MGYLIGKIFQGIVWISITIMQGFFLWIDVCDVVLTTFVVWLLMCVYFDWNGWWALALGLAVSLIVYIIFKHPIWFWVVSTLYSALWGYSILALVRFCFFKDISEIWFWVLAVALAAYVLLLHSDTRVRKDILEDLAAEEAAKAKL